MSGDAASFSYEKLISSKNEMAVKRFLDSFLKALRLEFRAQQERGDTGSDLIRSEDESTRDSTTSSEVSSRPDLTNSLENGHAEPMETENQVKG